MSLTNHNALWSQSDFSELFTVLLKCQAPYNGVIQCPTVVPALGMNLSEVFVPEAIPEGDADWRASAANPPLPGEQLLQ